MQAFPSNFHLNVICIHILESLGWGIFTIDSTVKVASIATYYCKTNENFLFDAFMHIGV